MTELTKVSNVLSPTKEIEQKDLLAANLVIDGQDNLLFIDPIRIMIGEDEYSKLAQESLSTFFLEFQKRIDSDESVSDLFQYIKEDEFVGGNRLGLSEIVHGEKPIGNGPGKTVERALTRATSKELVKNGVISDFSTVQLYVKGINKDKMSDMVTSIVKQTLSQFTEDIVSSHPDHLLESRLVEEKIWCSDSSEWVTREVEGYFYNGNRVVLVPKNWLSRDLDYTNRRFFSYFVFEPQLVKDALIQYMKFKDIDLAYEEMKIGQLKKIFIEVYGKPTKDVIASIALRLTQEKHISKINLLEYKLPSMTDELLEYYVDLPYTSIKKSE